MWELGRADDEDLDGALTLFEVVRDMQDRVSRTFGCWEAGRWAGHARLSVKPHELLD